MAQGPRETAGQKNAPSGAGPAVSTGPKPLGGALEAWRVILRDRALPLPLLRPLIIGSDPRSGIQLQHGTVRPFHVRLEKKGPAILARALDPAGEMLVQGRPAREAHLLGGEELTVGAIRLRVERAEVSADLRVSAPVPLSPQQEFVREVRAWISRAPWFLISAAVHACILLIAHNLLERPPEQRRVSTIIAEVDPPAEPIVPEEEVEIAREPELPPDEPRDLPEPELDLPAEEEEPTLDDAQIDETVGLGDLGHVGMGDGGPPVRGGFGGSGVSLGKVEGPLRERLARFRSSGLDVVFLVDTTSSMEPFLSAAKRTCDRIITDLAALIPNLRVGVVAYRDRGEAYVTRAVPLTDDRYAILNFLEGLTTAGGGDAPEAVLDAVSTALDDMQWRPKASRVMLLVCDAPPHPEDMGKLRLRLKTATRSRSGETALSVLYTGRGYGVGDRGERDLRELAEIGNGEFSRIEDMSQVVSHMIAMTLGTQYGASAERLLAQRRASPRAALVARKVEQRDIGWLVNKLRFVPVEPLVVDGLISIGSAAVAVRCMDIVTDPRALKPSKEAALYVLRRITRYRGALDFERALTAQPDELDELRRALDKTYRSR